METAVRAVLDRVYRHPPSVDLHKPSTAAKLKAVDIFRLLPGTICKKCGELTCLAFAVKLVGKDTEITKCAPLFSKRYHGKKVVLIELLQAAGHEIPREFLDSKEG